MRVQRGALAVDDLADVDDRGDPLLDGFQYPQRFPGRGGPLDADFGQHLVQPLPIAAAVGLVVQLCHNVPGIDCGCRGAGCVNVVRMAGAVRIVSDHHLRLIMLDELCDPAGGVLDGYATERIFPVLQAPPGHAGIVVPEQFEV